MGDDVSSLFSLRGRTAVITGASQGIGFEIARLYAQAGAKVVICSRKQAGVDSAAELIRQAGGQALAVAANVTSTEDRERLVSTALDWAGRLDILVNNAGANPSFGPLAELTEDAWDKIFAVNLKAAFFLSQSAYQSWMKAHGGSIIHVSSIGAEETMKGINAYNVTKAALNHLTRALASEWGPDGVRVNALAPGLIKTKFSQALWEDPISTQAIKSYPIPRFGQVEDLAGAALLLASEASSFITGHVLTVDGGQSLLNPHDALRKTQPKAAGGGGQDKKGN